MADTGAVLIVEDDRPMRALLAAALGKQGYRVEPVADGNAALAAAETGDFDLLLLDWVMPGLGGMETLQRLRERFGPTELPVVVVTSIDDSKEVVAALEAGANDYVTKPFDLAVVLARVRTQVTLRKLAADIKAASEAMRREIEAAAQVQRASLPAPEPRFGPYRFAWRYQPCEGLSGDGLNVFPVTARHVGFYVLDATGHGLRAALLSSAAGRLLLPAAGEPGVVSEPRGLLDRDVTALLTPTAAAVRPSEVAARLARRFRDYPAEGQFFTLLYGLLDVATGQVLYTSAGHPPPILLPAHGPPRRLPGSGLLIGVPTDDDAGYEDHALTLSPGDRLVIHSDGVTEARSPGGELFGDDRLLHSLAEAPPGLNAALDLAAAACDRWTEVVATEDDRTLLGLERLPT